MVTNRRSEFSLRQLPILNGRSQQPVLNGPLGQSARRFDNFKVGLVHPYLKEAQKKNRLKFRESLALGYLTAALESNDWSVLTVNAELRSLGPEEVGEILLAEPEIGLVGISAKSQRTYTAAKQIAGFIKRRRPEIHITIGGVFPTAADLQVMDDCADFDSIVRGEGEDAIVELSGHVAAGLPLDEVLGLTFRKGNTVARTANRPRIADLDNLHFPARRDLEYILSTGTEALASAYLVASRGCYAACTFCSIHQIYGDHLVKRRSPESIVAEMEDVIQRFGVSRFSFVDDLFITPSPNGILWVHDFCRVIEERGVKVNFYAEMRADTVDKLLINKLRKAGLHRLFIGMEAGSDSVLKRWDKGTTVAENDRAVAILREIDMPPHAVNFGYIMFDPEMTFDELKQQYQWLRNSGYCTVQHLQNKMNIYWGTPHYTRMLNQGRVDTSAFGQRWIYEFDDPLVNAVEAAFRRFHLRFQEESISEYLDANESFRFAVKVHHDCTNKELSPVLVDLLSQAQRRCEQAHRDAYYFVFDALLSFAEKKGSVPAELEDQIWGELTPLVEQLNRDSRHLLAFTREIAQLRMLADDGPPSPGTAWQEDGGRIGCVWLRGTNAGMGYRAVIGASGYDRYDHACELVDFSSHSKQPVKAPTLREVMDHGHATLVEMEIPL
jgi:hypothetical protein